MEDNHDEDLSDENSFLNRRARLLRIEKTRNIISNVCLGSIVLGAGMLIAVPYVDAKDFSRELLYGELVYCLFPQLFIKVIINMQTH